MPASHPPAYAPQRRPIPARDTPLANSLASWLARRGVSANAISSAGLLAGLLAGAALASTSLTPWPRAGFLAAALLIQLRLLANMLDGMVAVRTGRASALGELFNEVPDRVSDSAVCVGAGYAAGGLPELGYLAACVALFVAYVRAQGKAAGAPQEFCGPMAKPQRMHVLTAAALYAALAPAAWQPALPGCPKVGLPAAGLALIVAGGLWTAARRLRRIADQLRRAGP
jgi:phosphatidylglycerophosphate synthase